MNTTMQDSLRVLMLEDTPSDAELIQRELKKADIGFISRVVDTREAFEDALENFAPDIVLSDHALPQFNSLEALRLTKKVNPAIPFILVTGAVSEDFAVMCMKAGADDYILKSSLLRLPSSVRQLLSKRKVISEKQIIEQLNAELRMANREILQKNREITSSINYAYRIQKAILSPPQILERYFPDSFIIYRPKDVLSGDFYWLFQREGKIVIAVVDCTGHGIPGALMSIIGNILLNEIVAKDASLTPSVILQELQHKIRTYLRHEENDLIFDGMDIAICCISKNENKIEFAGANRPLFFLDGKNFKIYKGDKINIEGILSSEDKTYTNHCFSFKKGDCIYIFTDGYVDQFGGRKEKKMMTRNFIKLLNSIQVFDMGHQEKILNDWLEEWKGSLEQTDDILLLGVKF